MPNEASGLLSYASNSEDFEICVFVAYRLGSFGVRRVIPCLRLSHVRETHDDDAIARARSSERRRFAVEHHIYSALFLDCPDVLRKKLPDIAFFIFFLVFEGHFNNDITGRIIGIRLGLSLETANCYGTEPETNNDSPGE